MLIEASIGRFAAIAPQPDVVRIDAASLEA